MQSMNGEIHVISVPCETDYIVIVPAKHLWDAYKYYYAATQVTHMLALWFSDDFQL